MFRSLTAGFAIAGGVIAVALSLYAWHATGTPGAAQPSPWVFIIPWPTSVFLMGTEKMGHTGAIAMSLILIICNVLMYATIGWLVSVARVYLLRR